MNKTENELHTKEGNNVSFCVKNEISQQKR
jgi:hypothetical protein